MKMIRSVFVLLIAYTAIHTAQGMDCTFGQSKNIIDKVIHSCPNNPLFPDLEYCCPDLENQTFQCCNAEDFAIKTGLGIILPAVIAVVVVVGLIIFCISCLCCTCCPWYKRRHRGNVYGRADNAFVEQSVVNERLVPEVHRPGVVQVMQTPGNMQIPPGQFSHNAYAYPASQAAYNYGQAPNSQAPPQYTAQAYGQQAAYNPNYAAQ